MGTPHSEILMIWTVFSFTKGLGSTSLHTHTHTHTHVSGLKLMLILLSSAPRRETQVESATEPPREARL